MIGWQLVDGPAPRGPPVTRSCDCAAQRLGDSGAVFHDGVFIDATAGSGQILSWTELLRRFCPGLPGSAQPPASALTPRPLQCSSAPVTPVRRAEN